TVGGDDETVLENAVTAAQLDGVRLIFSVYPADPRATPLSARARGQFASFAASIAREFPAIRDVIVGNEPNLNRFWMPQFGLGGVYLAARSYELLLARTYDALKSVSDDVNVIGGRCHRAVRTTRQRSGRRTRRRRSSPTSARPSGRVAASGRSWTCSRSI